ncbi:MULTISPECIES: SGNH/GDSL hydrolase family protein [unclassified Rathayibacter]|uniref:SGNH/GDSL hydrolase family protein n=1 Tax=unclassified Rathayibacter TaxID=2609250 RepID=UPI000AE343C1|nr:MULTISPECIES: SGNH/GDSL hydrolase family protein [unclassified Rathayibacter]
MTSTIMFPAGEFKPMEDASAAMLIGTPGTKTNAAVIDVVAPIAADVIANDATAISAATALVSADLATRDLVEGDDRRIAQESEVDTWAEATVDPTTGAVLRGTDMQGKTWAYLREDSATDQGPISGRLLVTLENGEWASATVDPDTMAVLEGVRFDGTVYPEPTTVTPGNPSGGSSLKTTERAIVSVGDSLTFSSGTTWPETTLVAATGLPGYNVAMFGQRSQHQALLMGGITGQLTFAGNQLPAGGVAPVTTMGPDTHYWAASSGAADWIFPGSVLTTDGTRVDGQLAILANGAGKEFRYPPLTAAKPIKAASPFRSAFKGLMSRRIHTIWLGRNNVTGDDTSRLLSDVESILAEIESTQRRALVIGITPRIGEGKSATGQQATRYAQVIARNAQLRAAMEARTDGPAYFDMHGWLRDTAPGVLGVTPDPVAIADDQITPALYSDDTHFTAAVYAAIGTKVGQILVAKGWTL